MFLETFLQRHQLDVDRLTSAVREHLAPANGEVCYVTGSLVEGLGNYRSDIDVYLLTERDLSDRLLGGTMTMLALGNSALDIEVKSPRLVETLLARLADLPSDQVRDHRVSALAFSPAELKFLHNLRISAPLGNEAAHRAVIDRIDTRSLSRILFDYSVAWADTLHTDLLGLIEEGDYLSARHLLLQYLGHLAGAFLAATGNTNPADKWRVRKLTQLEQSSCTEPLPGGLDIARTAAAFQSLYLTCEANGRAVRAQLSRILKLAYAIIPWGQRRFLSGEPLTPKPGDASQPRIVPPPPSPDRNGDEILRPLMIGCRVRYAGGGYALTAIDHPAIFNLNDLAYELLLHFDGSTTTDDAVRHLGLITPASPEEIADTVRDFRLVLESRGLTQLLAAGEPI